MSAATCLPQEPVLTLKLAHHNLSTLSDRICSTDENNLVGTIPTAIGLLTTLAELDLHSNEISGSIPTEIGTLTSLSYLDLDVSGLVPKHNMTIAW